MKSYIIGSAIFIGCLSAFTCQAGKIVIVDSALERPQTESDAERRVDEARRYLRGDPSHPVYVEGDESTSQAAELRREAGRYLDDSPSGVNSDGQTILILRTDPSTGAEKMRSNARFYVTEPVAKTGPVANTEPAASTETVANTESAASTQPSTEPVDNTGITARAGAGITARAGTWTTAKVRAKQTAANTPECTASAENQVGIVEGKALNGAAANKGGSSVVTGCK
jgi:hypothetical protein